MWPTPYEFFLITIAYLVAASVGLVIVVRLGNKAALKCTKEGQEESSWREVSLVFSKMNPLGFVMVVFSGSLSLKMIIASSSLLQILWVGLLYFGQAFAFCLYEYWGVLLESEKQGLLTPGEI